MGSDRTTKVVLVLKDSNKRHNANCEGLAYWLSELTGADIIETEIPVLTGVQRTKALATARNLIYGSRRDAREWLSIADGDILVREVGHWFAEHNVRQGSDDAIIISSGDESALYNLALGYIWRNKSVTIEIPGVVGTAPFDFAIIPESQFPDRKENIFITTGILNGVTEKNISSAVEKFKERYTIKKRPVWTLIIGGNTENSYISVEWIKSNVGYLAQCAEHAGTSLYIHLVAEQDADVFKTLKNIETHSDNVTIFTGKTDDETLRWGLYGISDKIFCTEDLFEIIIESLTSGKKVILMEIEHRKNLHFLIVNIVEFLVKSGAIPGKYLWRVRKHGQSLENLIRKGYLIDFRYHISPVYGDNGIEDSEGETFNEARRAAKWIHSKLSL